MSEPVILSGCLIMATDRNNEMFVWSRWRPFPDPRNCGILSAPIGAGVYELRNSETKAFVLCGISKHTAKRMTSLFPRGIGSGTRRNSKKKDYVWENLPTIEYRTVPTFSREEARSLEKNLLESHDYIFPT